MSRGSWLKVLPVAAVVVGYPLALHWALTHWAASQRVLAWLTLLQNVSMQGALAVLFGTTLRRGAEPLVARFARRVHGPEYNDDIARYARGATWAWTLFFVAMVLMPVLLFAFAPVEIFSLFVNVWSLPLLALMFGAEYAARRWILRGVHHVPLWRSFSLYREERAQPAPGPDSAPGAGATMCVLPAAPPESGA